MNIPRETTRGNDSQPNPHDPAFQRSIDMEIYREDNPPPRVMSEEEKRGHREDMGKYKDDRDAIVRLVQLGFIKLWDLDRLPFFNPHDPLYREVFKDDAPETTRKAPKVGTCDQENAAVHNWNTVVREGPDGERQVYYDDVMTKIMRKRNEEEARAWMERWPMDTEVQRRMLQQLGQNSMVPFTGETEAMRYYRERQVFYESEMRALHRQKCKEILAEIRDCDRQLAELLNPSSEEEFEMRMHLHDAPENLEKVGNIFRRKFVQIQGNLYNFHRNLVRWGILKGGA
uniref:Uncharacterized protein n=1 Tax=Chromera velia CCMP2878 TaxID=1169474 RepID=A0A0G4IE90_9ALVE|eukprot:Cvel_13664.t1-p1 / transcript=Cvel_13664.t1 / gene=Cvel_13664 / organism=Chromera_velia_CCMP2878 / gene_product=hypothetical protein / transcript_product=hypothetical protein / location=Cvel_scaffold943:30987-33647(+) / protein_length=285 / sequence_SO=supercontig / SO=protein_coding / is_pseudo=false